MLKVYCDVCGAEIVEDKGCEDEGIDWKELQLRSSINNIVIDDIEHICKQCLPIVTRFIEALKSGNIKEKQSELVKLFVDIREGR